MQYLLSVLILILIPSVSLAGIFDPPPTDMSLYFLERIFGNVGNVLFGETNISLQSMFDKYNWAIVSVAIIILGYTTVVSILNTAKEGQVMGKKWNSLWIPIRSILGILLLIPTAGSGYSLIQVTIMWIVVQGVGLADQIWDIILTNLAQGVSATAAPQLLPSDKSDLNDNAKAIYTQAVTSAVCMFTLKNIHDGETNDTILNTRDAEKSNLTRIHGNKISIFIDPNYPFRSGSVKNKTIAIQENGFLNVGVKNVPTYKNACGSWEISASINSQNDANLTSQRLRSLYYAKINSIMALFNVAKMPARRIANIKNPPDNINDLASSTYAIYSSILSKYTTLLSGQVEYQTNMDIIARNLAEKGKAEGWIVAGSYYFTLFKVQMNSLLSNAKELPSFSGPKLNVLSEKEKPILTAKLITSTLYSNVLKSKSTPSLNDKLSGLGGDDDQHGLVKEILTFIIDWIAKITDYFIKILIGDIHDPIVVLSFVGQTLMLWAQNAWLAFAAIGIASSILALCSAKNPLFLTVLSVIIIVGGIILALLMIVFTIGASLGIYLPMVPYIIFAGAVLGWMMLVIEAIIAGPIIALGIIAPSQDELGKIMPAIMILANIFLRPMLMIFGFIFAARLLRAIVEFINFGFFQTALLILNPGSFIAGAVGAMTVAGGIGGMATGAIVTIIFIIMIYATLIITVTNRVFSLIYLLPDKILRWIGGQAEAAGQEAEKIEGKAKGGYDKGSASVSKVQAGMASQASKGVGTAKEHAAATQKKEQ